MMRRLLIALTVLPLLGAGESYTGARINVTAGGASAITAAFTAGRTTTSCAHPCAVVFEATGTTDTDGTIAPFHELRYVWDFGDSRSETWTRDGRDKNTELGPIAAHVFECPSADTSGTVTLTVSRDGTTSDQATMAWDCDSPATQWPTTETKCASDTADVSWCPSGSTTLSSQPDLDVILATSGWLAADRRIVLRCGGSYTTNGTTVINVDGPGYIGGNDCGTNRPVITRTANALTFQISAGGSNPAMNDWRFHNMRLVDDTAARTENFFAEAGRIRKLTLHDLIIDDCSNCVGLYGSISSFYGTSVPNAIVISETVITRDTATMAAGSYPLTLHGDYTAVIGVEIDNPQNNANTHMFRTTYTKYFVTAHSKFLNAYWDRPSISLRCEYGVSWGDCNFSSLISNEWQSDTAHWMLEIGGDASCTPGPDCNNYGNHNDVVIYDNWIHDTGNTGFAEFNGIQIYANRTTAARNVIKTSHTDVSYGIKCTSNNVNTATDCRAYNNTFYDLDTNNDGPSAAYQNGIGTGGEAVGNLAIYHSTDDADGVICASCALVANNLADRDGTHPFVTLPPVVEADFELSAGISPAHSPVVLDTVSTAHYWEYDHAGVACSGNCDAGAYERE